MKPKGNQILRFPTIYNIPISKEEMNIIIDTGLIKGIDRHGFVIFDNDNLSGSHVHWSNLKEIRTGSDGQSLELIYNNLSDEVLANRYENWNQLIAQIPEDFGDFQHLQKIAQSEESQSEEDNENLVEVDDAKNMLAEINQMREEFMGESDHAEPIEPETQEEVFTPNVATTEVVEDAPKVVSQGSNEDLLRKILAEAEADMKYTSSNLRFSSDEGDLDADIVFSQNGTIQNATSIGLEIFAAGELHKIDFGKFSDAFYDTEKKILVLEHRYGRTLSLPQQMKGWKDLIQKIPFKFRSFDRKKMWELSK